MSRHKERARMKRQQKARSRWLIIFGLTLVVVSVAWIVFSSRESASSEVSPISRLTTGDFHSLAFSPTEPETIFFGHHGGLLVSHNGGKDWELTTLSGADAMA